VVVAAGIYWNSGMMKEYQKARITNIFQAEQNKQGSGYHVTQAKIAIGSGGMWGKGLGKGTQVQGGFVPEEHTDFIFTVVGEELGFVGAVTVALLYVGLLLRGAMIVASAHEDTFGKLIATGIVSVIAFHVFVNISMNLGIFPVAGVPLLLLSYGGNNILVVLTSIGVLQSIVRHRHQLLF
jgi:rod shape determining protein RodA